MQVMARPKLITKSDKSFIGKSVRGRPRDLIHGGIPGMEEIWASNAASSRLKSCCNLSSLLKLAAVPELAFHAFAQ